MAVQQDGAGGTRDRQVAIDEGVAAGPEDLGAKPVAIEHGAKVGGIPLDVLDVGADVGNREQVDELGDDRALMGGDVGVQRLAHA